MHGHAAAACFASGFNSAAWCRSAVCRSCVAGWWNGGARVYPSATEALTTASVTAFDPFSRLFGSEALKQVGLQSRPRHCWKTCSGCFLK